MRVLSNLQTIEIRATHSYSMAYTSLSNVAMDTAITVNNGQQQPIEVEECRCPEGHIGTSCEVRLSRVYFAICMTRDIKNRRFHRNALLDITTIDLSDSGSSVAAALAATTRKAAFSNQTIESSVTANVGLLVPVARFKVKSIHAIQIQGISCL